MLQQLDTSLISSILTKTASELLKAAIKAEDAREKAEDTAATEDDKDKDQEVEPIVQDDSYLRNLMDIANCSGGSSDNGLSVRILRAKLLASRRSDCADWELPALNLQSQIIFMMLEKFLHRKQPTSFGRLLYLVLVGIYYLLLIVHITFNVVEKVF